MRHITPYTLFEAWGDHEERHENTNQAFNAAGPMKIEGRWVLHDASGDRVGETFIYKDTSGFVSLSSIDIDKDKRGRGHFRAFLQQLCDMADANEWTIVATPDNYKGSSVRRITAINTEYGFVKNRGRKKDYRIRETMYRKPR